MWRNIERSKECNGEKERERKGGRDSSNRCFIKNLDNTWLIVVVVFVILDNSSPLLKGYNAPSTTEYEENYLKTVGDDDDRQIQ